MTILPTSIEGLLQNIVPINHRRCGFYYQQSVLFASQFDKDGIIYRQSVCTNQEMDLIREEVSEATKHLTEERSSIAQHRLGTTISRDSNSNSDIIRIFQEGSIFSLLERVSSTTTITTMATAKRSNCQKTYQ